jgi:hypothetical protein
MATTATADAGASPVSRAPEVLSEHMTYHETLMSPTPPPPVVTARPLRPSSAPIRRALPVGMSALLSAALTSCLLRACPFVELKMRMTGTRGGGGSGDRGVIHSRRETRGTEQRRRGSGSATTPTRSHRPGSGDTAHPLAPFITRRIAHTASSGSHGHQQHFGGAQ